MGCGVGDVNFFCFYLFIILSALRSGGLIRILKDFFWPFCFAVLRSKYLRVTRVEVPVPVPQPLSLPFFP